MEKRTQRLDPTEESKNLTLEKIELIKQYQKKEITLNEVVDRIYVIDSASPPRLLKGLAFFVAILAAPILSHTRDKNT